MGADGGFAVGLPDARVCTPEPLMVEESKSHLFVHYAPSDDQSVVSPSVIQTAGALAKVRTYRKKDRPRVRCSLSCFGLFVSPESRDSR